MKGNHRVHLLDKALGTRHFRQRKLCIQEQKDVEKSMSVDDEEGLMENETGQVDND
jgi:hypothetical protein